VKNKKLSGIILSVLSVFVMVYIEKVIAPTYAVKSLFKILLFLGAIIIYMLISRDSLSSVIGLSKVRLPKKLIYLMLGAYIFILAVFFALRGFIDTASIRESLMVKEQLTRENCLFVFAYIMICNSFLEEAFFRGFVFNLINGEDKHTRAAYIISGLLFAVYHIGIVDSWFSPVILALCIVGLAAVGMFLQLVSRKCKTIKASWLIHGCANLAINTIGAILIFGA